MGASTDNLEEAPLRATPTTAWTNSLTENQKRRRYQIPGTTGLATAHKNQGQLDNIPTGCLEPSTWNHNGKLEHNTYNGG